MNVLVSLILQHSRTSTLVSLFTVSLTLYKWLNHAPDTKRPGTVTSFSGGTVATRLRTRIKQLGRPSQETMAAQFDALTELRIKLHLLDGHLESLQIMLLRMDGYLASLRPALAIFTSATGITPKHVAPFKATKSKKRFSLVRWRTNK
ncbi:protein of unknown function [Taphrina deformans PYCC 5710]|uniref:Uncharacterized protein n=1 Tax=Taphrina deformans (strain PYCC 5710 / ATCC 11124 / CBS 356.35 / IMI 108563 / JCM 9778 / NBRC 8474) TaxID=1097556 RepID=R4XCH7_TAPDE|nr:protein of unknown function [Taphrina deformans PYCC 5710]|eukprot:CCG83572.1 protein of unknown function [Taphrina deformans PYCC 5710]